MSQFKVDVAGRAVGGGAKTLRDPGDQIACEVSPPAGVSVENHRGVKGYHSGGIGWLNRGTSS